MDIDDAQLFSCLLALKRRLNDKCRVDGDSKAMFQVTTFSCSSVTETS